MNMDKLRIWTGLSCDVSLLWWRNENVWWSTYLIVSLLPDVTVKEHQSLWWTTSHHTVGQWENWNPPTTLTRFDELNLRKSEQCFLRPSSHIQRMMKRTARRLIRLIAAIWGHFGTKASGSWANMVGPPHKNIKIDFLVSHVSFLPKEAHMDRQHARHTGLFCGTFLFLPVFADTFPFRGVLHFSISRKGSLLPEVQLLKNFSISSVRIHMHILKILDSTWFIMEMLGNT